MSVCGQPVGPLVTTGPAKLPSQDTIVGKYCNLELLRPSHAPSLFLHLGGEENAWRWTYMLSGPFLEEDAFSLHINNLCESRDSQTYAIVVSGNPVGMFSYISVVPDHQRLEIGSVIYGGVLTRTREATEAISLLVRHAIEELGYRRIEWKANDLNAPSLAAAKRLGFTFEGVFRKHLIIKGRSRDTAWYSITDDEWPAVNNGFVAWLDEANFDGAGKQKRSLEECRLFVHAANGNHERVTA